MIDFEEDRRVWEQVYTLLRGRIEAGVYKERLPIPSLRRLLEEIPVAEGTLQKALNRLKAEGYIRAIHGKGTFVRAREHWTPPDDGER